MIALGYGLCLGPAVAQDVDCSRLKAQIDAGRGDSGRAAQFGAALRQQQYELDRTRNYSESIGCNSGFFFGAPPQCATIDARVERMQETIDQLRRQMEDGGEGGSTHRALIEQYNTYCSRSDPDEPVPGQQVSPTDADPPSGDTPQDPDAAPSHRVQSKALCVRHCDGAFFPITEQATSDNLDRLAQICKAQCPNAEASLYTVSPSAGIENAAAPDGTPYTELPAAFKYQKSYDPTCSCKPANQSWVQALAEAETLLEKDKNDVVVTKQISDAMSRPVPPGTPDTTPRPPRKTKTARKAKPAPAPSAEPPPGVADQLDPVAPSDDSGEDITRQFRRSGPTL